MLSYLSLLLGSGCAHVLNYESLLAQWLSPSTSMWGYPGFGPIGVNFFCKTMLNLSRPQPAVLPGMRIRVLATGIVAWNIYYSRSGIVVGAGASVAAIACWCCSCCWLFPSPAACKTCLVDPPELTPSIYPPSRGAGGLPPGVHVREKTCGPW